MVDGRMTISRTRFVTGTLLVGLSAAAFGTLAIFGRFAYADGMDTFTILFLRFSLAALVMLVLLAVRRQRLPRGASLLRLTGMGALGYVGQAFCYLTALRYASAGLVALLLYLYPVFVALLAAWLLREKLTGPRRLALVLAVLGTALTVGPAGGQALGIALAVGAAAIYSVYIMVGTQVMKQVPAIPAAAVIFSAAGLTAGALALAGGLRLPATGLGWSALAAIVVLATVVPVVTFLAGLERIGPTNAAMLSTLEPVVTVLLAAVWLGESLAPLALLGGSLILAAVWLLTRSQLGPVTAASQGA
jgi:drug/metabolite transporter (DMT)-like permease